MKKHLQLLAALSFIIVSCSSDNDNTTPPPTNSSNFFPISSEQFWVYEVSAEDTPTTRDSLYVLGEEQFNNKTYHRLKAREPFFGFYSSAMNNNLVRNESGKLMVTGNFSLAGLEDLFDLDLSLNDFIIFDENASNNQQLSAITGETQQNLEDIPVTISYTLRTNALNTIPSFTASNGQVYTDVKPMTVTLRMSVNLTIGPPLSPIPLNLAILQTQDVAISTSYYVNNIGVVQTDTHLQYQLNTSILSLLPIELPIPPSGSSSSNEKLVNYFQP